MLSCSSFLHVYRYCLINCRDLVHRDRNVLFVKAMHAETDLERQRCSKKKRRNCRKGQWTSWTYKNSLGYAYAKREATFFSKVLKSTGKDVDVTHTKTKPVKYHADRPLNASYPVTLTVVFFFYDLTDWKYPPPPIPHPHKKKKNEKK